MTSMKYYYSKLVLFPNLLIKNHILLFLKNCENNGVHVIYIPSKQVKVHVARDI